MTYDEALIYIHNLRWTGKKAGLSKTKEMLSMLGNPERKLKYVHIAGTNGKGSVAAMTASILQKAGYKVGMFTSPFIVRFNERIQVNRQEISNSALAQLTDKVRNIIEQMKEPPSEFEVVTVIGFLYFVMQGCHIVVLETGLGGMFDSTNVIPCPEVAVITTIGFDHMKELGNTIQEIAAAKAGIIKEHSTVVFYGENEEAEKVIRKTCEETESRLVEPDFSTIVEYNSSLQEQTFRYKNYDRLQLKLLGAYQQKNASLVIEIVEQLKNKGYTISTKEIIDGLRDTGWPVRFEVVSKEPYVIVDGSHNPQGMAATVETMKKYAKGRTVICVFGVMADKNIDKMSELLLSVATKVIAVQPEYPRAMQAEKLFSKIRTVAKQSNSNTEILLGGKVADGLNLAYSKCDKEDIILAVGSLYMAGEVIQWNRQL